MQIHDLDDALWSRSDCRDRYQIQVLDQNKQEVFNSSGTILVKYYDDQEYYYINGANLTNALKNYIDEMVEVIIHDEPGII